jgi:lysophospholipase L1-like esterase
MSGARALRGAACALAALWLTAQAQPRAATPPQVGVLADPCAEDPDKWRGNPDAWRELDWGQRCRYFRQNQQVRTATGARVVFIGDSITESWADADPGLFADGFLNRGISGQTSDQMLVRFRSDVIGLEPRVVHIMAGINDVAGNMGPTSLGFIAGNIQSMVEEALLHRIRVVIASVPPAAHIPWRAQLGRPDLVIATLNDWLRDYARCENVVFADYAAVLGDGHGGMKAEFSPDGVHPNAAAYAAMRPLARAAVARALARPAAGAPFRSDCAAPAP